MSLRMTDPADTPDSPTPTDNPPNPNDAWIQTFTGAHFHPFRAQPGEIRIEDIAHALSLQCRFNGHCRHFYSVAEHSVRVSEALPHELALWGLLHDAAEAYVSDLPRPLKDFLPQFRELEDRVLRLIIKTFGLTWPMPPEVDHADLRLLATECRDLMAIDPRQWDLTINPLPARIQPLSPRDAEEAFLRRFRSLTTN